MQNDVSRQWASSTPFVPGEVFTAQAQQIESIGHGRHLRARDLQLTVHGPRLPGGRDRAGAARQRHPDRLHLQPFRDRHDGHGPRPGVRRALVLGLGTSTRQWVEGFHGMTGYGKPVEHLRETIGLIRQIIKTTAPASSPAPFEGKYNKHDWSTFLGAFAPPIRERSPSGSAPTRRASPAWPVRSPRASSTTPSTAPSGRSTTAATPWLEGLAQGRAGTARTSTGTAGSGWRSTTTAPRPSTMPGPPSPSTPACGSTAHVRHHGLRQGGGGLLRRLRAGGHPRLGRGHHRRDGGDLRHPRLGRRLPQAGRGGVGPGRLVLPRARPSAACPRRRSCSTSAASRRRSTPRRIAVLCGGFGAARFLAGLRRVRTSPSPASSTPPTTSTTPASTSPPTSTPSPTPWPAATTSTGAGA